MVSGLLNLNFIFSLIFLSLCIRSSASNSSSLKGAFIIFRHGHRAPYRSYPNDPHKDYPWEGGFGFLSQLGVRQVFELGVRFRARYQTLMPKDQVYGRSPVRIRSSAETRCLMSAQSFMAGFLPPPKKWVLPIRWQPAVIESVPKPQDSAIAQEKYCSKYNMTIVERTNLDNQEIMDFMGPKFYLFSYISEHMGMRITLLHDIVRLVDTLQQESKVGLQIPSWALDLYNDTLIPLDLLSHHLTYQTKLSYVRAGSLLNEIMKYLDNFSKPSTNKRRISIMSGHDLTVGSIAYLLGFNSQIPLLVDFACTLAIELYESPQLGDDYEIKFLFFRNHADDNPIQIRIPECSSPCSIKTFRKIAESKVVDDYDRVCNNYHENDVHFVNL